MNKGEQSYSKHLLTANNIGLRHHHHQQQPLTSELDSHNIHLIDVCISLEFISVDFHGIHHPTLTSCKNTDYNAVCTMFVINIILAVQLT